MSSSVRVFIGKSSSLSTAIAEYLLDRFDLEIGKAIMPGSGDELPLVLIPGSRALRNLRDALIEQASTPAVVCPPMRTPGALPEELIESNRPIASSLLLETSFVRVLKELKAEDLSRVYMRERDGIREKEWWQIARELVSYYSELEAALVDDDTLLRCVAQCSDGWELERERWKVFFSIRDKAISLLEQEGFYEKHSLRRGQLQAVSEWKRPIVVAGVPDLSPLHRAFLQKCTDVSYLIQADETEADRFDSYGQPSSDYWMNATLETSHARIFPLGSIQDEASFIASACKALTERTSELPVICTADAGRQEMIAHALKSFGLQAHYTEGLQLSRSPLASFLRVLQSAAEASDWQSFSPLLRHPFTALWYESEGKGDFFRMLKEADAAYTNALFFDLDEHDAVPEAIRNIREHFTPLYKDVYNFNEWPSVAGPLIHPLVNSFFLSCSETEQEAVKEVVSRFQSLLSDIVGLPDAFSPRLDGASFLSLVQQLMNNLVAGKQQEADGIEMLGWLEALHDNGNYLIVSGVNEGMLPENITHDAWLPHSVREILGIKRNDDRYCRDVYIMDRLMHSRKEVVVSFSLKGERGEPLKPGRMLYAVEESSLVQRVKELFVPYKLESHTGTALKKEFLCIPPPATPMAVPERMGVSDFSLYLRDPYRYYLKKGKHLLAETDEALELSSLLFGSAAHYVIEQFAQSGSLSSSREAAPIYRFLKTTTEMYFKERFGYVMLPAIRIQMEQLLSRLNAFSKWQASWNARGYTQLASELSLYAPLEVDGLEVEVSGKIDRIDKGPDNVLYVLDYKTSETARSPGSAHRKKSTGEWKDLQLPLYYYLMKHHEEFRHASIVPGYIPLSQDTGKISEFFVDTKEWNDTFYEEAIECAKNIVRAIRNGEFPPSSSFQFEDEFTVLMGEDQRVNAVYREEKTS